VRAEILVVRPSEDDESGGVDGARVPLGTVAEVKDALCETFGVGTWNSPDQGLFDAADFSLLAKLGIFPEVDSLTLEVWGLGDPRPAIRSLCLPRNWVAFDLESGDAVTDLGGA
jgi:hypothetical protein